MTDPVLFDLDDAMTVHVDADLSAFRADIGEATRLARGFGTALTNAFENAIVKGKSLSDVLKDLALRLASLALDAALKPLSDSLSAVVGSAVSAIVPFARGGVIGGPTLFAPGGGFGSVLGLVGEAGPEAIMPLRRGADGRLGVAAQGAAEPARAVSVKFNIQSPDVEGFRRARGQIAADLSRVLERGYRNR